MSLRRVAFGVLVVSVPAGALVLQTSMAAQEVPATFRGGVQLIEVDVVATDRQGKPVRDLTRDDFEIVEHNRPQEIRTFTLVDLQVEKSIGPTLRPGSGVEPDIVGNTAPEGRTYVLLLDVGQDLRGRHLAERWLDEVVQPYDRVAVVHAQGTFSDSQPFTSSRQLSWS